MPIPSIYLVNIGVYLGMALIAFSVGNLKYHPEWSRILSGKQASLPRPAYQTHHVIKLFPGRTDTFRWGSILCCGKFMPNMTRGFVFQVCGIFRLFRDLCHTNFATLF
jgi:hypothetical protein